VHEPHALTGSGPLDDVDADSVALSRRLTIVSMLRHPVAHRAMIIASFVAISRS
jgi:hypothetical protein